MKQKNLSIPNPFQFGVVIDNSAFCNRKEEISFLKAQINNGYSTWLYSPRRFGKTSLISKVFRETKGATCIFIDLYNIRSTDDFCRKYANIMARELFDWRENIKSLTKKLSGAFKNLSPGVTFDQYGNPGFNLNIQKIEKQPDVETILEIPNIISGKRKGRICIAFDEFQEITRIDPFLLNWMRSAFQRHINISYIFSGSKPSMMEDIFTSTRSPFYEFASKMNLSVISRTELYNFIREKFLVHDLPIKNHTIEKILEKSDCQPHYTQYFASVVFDMIKTGIDQDDDDFHDLWIKKVLLPQVDIFQNIYDQLTNIQRVTLQALSKITDMGIFSEEARRTYDLPVSSSLNEGLKALQRKSLVYKSNDTFKIANPVLKEWIMGLE